MRLDINSLFMAHFDDWTPTVLFKTLGKHGFDLVLAQGDYFEHLMRRRL